MDNKEIGSRLKEIREEKKITQSDFASSLRISRSHLAGLETGAKNFTNRILDDLYNFYGINKDWLLNGIGEKYISTENDVILGEVFADITMSKNENLRELIINISKLNDTYINNLNEIVKGLI